MRQFVSDGRALVTPTRSLGSESESWPLAASPGNTDPARAGAAWHQSPDPRSAGLLAFASEPGPRLSVAMLPGPAATPTPAMLM